MHNWGWRDGSHGILSAIARADNAREPEMGVERSEGQRRVNTKVARISGWLLN